MSTRITVLAVRGEGAPRAELLLVPGRDLVVGRDAGADLVLDDDRVSRRHLSVRLESDDEIVLQDLGSTNGSFLGGEPLRRARVRPGTRVVVGATVLEIEQRARVPEDRPHRAPPPRSPTLASDPWLLGHLQEIPLFIVLQLLANMRKSGVLEIRGPRVGRIHVASGKVEHASIEGLPPGHAEKALYRMLAWREGRFQLGPAEPRTGLAALDLGTEEILLEGHRHIDELERLRPSLPAPEARVRATLAASSDAALSPIERELARLAAEGTTFSALVDAAPATDLEACEIVRSLIARGVLAVA